MDEIVDEIVVLAVLAMRQVLDQPLPPQQFVHARELALQLTVRVAGLDFGHGCRTVPR